MVKFTTMPLGDIAQSWTERPSTSVSLSLGEIAPVASISAGKAFAPNPVFELAKAKSLSLRVHKIKGDGKCMFRAIAQGLAKNKGMVLLGVEETNEADQLRMAVFDALCHGKPKAEYRPAVKSAEVDAPLPQYCTRIQSPTFWGGEPELLALSQMLKTPIFVYLSEAEQRTGFGYVPIQKYGEQFLKKGKTWKARRPVRLLYTGGNHYDLLTQ